MPPQPLSAAAIEARIRELLASSLDGATLRRHFDELAQERHFAGFTWLWGPKLYARDRVRFRPFIRANFSDFRVETTPQGWWSWHANDWRPDLEAWLVETDRADDADLFRRLFAWKHRASALEEIGRKELAARITADKTPGRVQVTLQKLDLWFRLDEATALLVYERGGEAGEKFILSHLPFRWSGHDVAFWSKLHARALERGDARFASALYRRLVTVERWTRDVAGWCASIADPVALCETLQQHHPESIWTDLGGPLLDAVTKRGRDVLPYLMRHLRAVWGSWWGRGNWGKLRDLAREREMWDLWAATIRVCAPPNDWNAEVRRLLDERRLPEAIVTARLLSLSGVSREWNFPGLGLAVMHQLLDDVAVSLYRRDPALLRGPFKPHIQVSHWSIGLPRLLGTLLDAHDDDLADFVASRYATAGGYYNAPQKELVAGIEKLADHYAALKAKDEAAFTRRAAAVLGQIPAFTIFRYDPLIKNNRLARLLFERSNSALLSDARAMRDLVEAPEIHVQVLAYRTLGLDDDRARALAKGSLDVLLGTLFRPLHHATRRAAFAALSNAASTEEDAGRVVARAREALDLPDERYPKEALVGLIGRVLARFPRLVVSRENPIVYRRH